MNTSTLAEHFKSFASLKSSAIYAELSDFISTQPEILQSVAHIPLQKSPRTILFAAVHALLLQGIKHPLADFYPSVNGAKKLNEENRSELNTCFSDFFQKYKDKITPFLMNNTQTNEARRSVSLLPAFSEIVKRERVHHFSMIEIGSSAGFLLNVDQYYYDLNGFKLGNSKKIIPITTQWKGAYPENLQTSFIKIDHKIGIDLNPLDVSDESVRLWLKALIWPEQIERLTLFEMACDVLEQNKHAITIFKGHFEDYINQILKICADSRILCFVCVWVLYQFNVDEKQRLNDQLSFIAKSSKKKIYFILDNWEINKASAPNHIILREFNTNGHYSDLLICKTDHHGQWVTVGN